jgi:type IV secretory pathway TrbD component
VVMILAPRWTVLRLAVPSASSTRLGMGGIALILMLVAEFGFMLWLRGLSIREYLATRDPVSGTVYYAMLVVFSAMPLLVFRGSQ